MKPTLKPWGTIAVAGALGVLAFFGEARAAHATSAPVDPPQRAVTDRPAAPLGPDPTPANDTYHYMAIVPPGRVVPRWADYGRVLWQEDEQALLVATPVDAEGLVAAGAAIALVSPEPPELPSGQAAASVTLNPLTSPDPLVQGMIGQVTSDTVATYVRQLSGDLPITVGGSPYTLTTRRTNSGEPIAKAIQFVGDHLAALDYNVEYHDWSSGGNAGRNVIAELPGQTAPRDVFIIGAHLDDIANRLPVGPPDPGADDNATGSAATMVAAEILSQYYWGCTLRFALWTGEEQGLLGSAVYAARSASRGETIRGYLNLDMLGYNGPGDLAAREVNLFWKSSIPASGLIADTFISVNSTYGLALIPFKYDAAVYAIGNYSDNGSFWSQWYPAILVIEDHEGDFTPYYHTKNDVYATLDLDYLTGMVKAAVGTFAHMTGCLISDEPIHVTPSLPGGDVVNLRWYHTAPNSAYQVWRNLDPGGPYFAPGDGDCEELDPAPTTPNLGVAVDYPDGAGDPDGNHYYLVQGFNGEGHVATTSQRVGVFSFALVPGAIEP